MSEILKEKLEWMKEVGIMKFKRPMMYFDSKGSMVYSEEYIKETPLDVLKLKHKTAFSRAVRNDTILVFDNECECKNALSTMQKLENIVEIAKKEGLALGILVSMKGFEKPELIVNPPDNLDDKLEYWKKTYGEDLKHKSVDGIEIIGFIFQ